MSQDEEGFASFEDWKDRALKAEVRAEAYAQRIADMGSRVERCDRVEANLIDAQAQVRQLTADNNDLRARIKRLQADAFATQKGLEGSHRENQELYRRLALAEERRADAQNALKEMQEVCAEATEARQAEFALPETFLEEMELAMVRFAEGYAEYGPGAADVLGLAGQWGDLHRKIMKLKRAMWSGEEGYLTREAEGDILRDIIGHSLLALEMYSRGLEPGR